MSLKEEFKKHVLKTVEQKIENPDLELAAMLVDSYDVEEALSMILDDEEKALGDLTGEIASKFFNDTVDYRYIECIMIETILLAALCESSQ